MPGIASDPAQNPYWKRDVRRAYPQLSMVTQSELSQLLIQHSRPQACVVLYLTRFTYSHIISHRIPAPSESKEAEKSSAPVEASKSAPVDLTTAITEVTSANKVYSAAKLPPRLPSPFKRWHPELAPDAPHDPNAYFPMVLYK